MAKDSKRKRKIEDDIKLVKYAIDHAVQVLAVVSKSALSDEDIHLRIIGQFDGHEEDAWDNLSKLEQEEMYEYASSQCTSDNKKFLYELGQNFKAVIHESDATLQEHEDYLAKVQAWLEDKDTKSDFPALLLKGPILSALCDTEIVTALFSRTVMATNPGILNDHPWSACAQNFVSHIGQVMLQMRTKDEVLDKQRLTNYENKTGDLEDNIIDKTLDDVRDINQSLICKATDNLITEDDYQDVHPADPYDMCDYESFYMPAARDTELYGLQRR